MPVAYSSVITHGQGPYATSQISGGWTLASDVTMIIGCEGWGDDRGTGEYAPTYNGSSLSDLYVVNDGAIGHAQLWYMLNPPTGSSYTYAHYTDGGIWTIGAIALARTKKVYTGAFGDMKGDAKWSGGYTATASMTNLSGLQVGYQISWTSAGWDGGTSCPDLTSRGTSTWDAESCFGNGSGNMYMSTGTKTGSNSFVTTCGSGAGVGIILVDVLGVPGGNQVIWFMFKNMYDRYREALKGLRKPFDWKDLYRRSYKDALPYAPKPYVSSVLGPQGWQPV